MHKKTIDKPVTLRPVALVRPPHKGSAFSFAGFAKHRGCDRAVSLVACG